jgi:hypothetical protein
MGRNAVSQALAHLATDPLNLDLLLSTGFAGGLTGFLSAGDVCLVDEFIDFDTPSGFTLRQEFTDCSEDLCRIIPPCATCITLKEPPDKLTLASTIERPCALVDMESYHAASFAHDRGLAFLCIRAVSDGPHDLIGFDIAAIADGSGSISMAGVARTILQNPFTMISFFKCRQRANIAAERLADTLANILSLPVHELQKLSRELRVISTQQ